MRFLNRTEAGRQLGRQLRAYAHRDDVIVLGLPRGGVVVAYEVAQALQATLDVFLVRKLGVPGQEELAMGAIASGGARVMNERVMRLLNISPGEVERVVAREQAELERREKAYRGDRPPLAVQGKVTIVVDDGLATGSTMRAAIMALHSLGAEHIVVAVPVAPPETCLELQQEVEAAICLVTPPAFMSISQWYEDFTQVSDEEVCAFLEQAQTAPVAQRNG